MSKKVTFGKKFQKKVEDFVCEECGHSVKGTGYTSHCSKCLYSKHVDINPGDRAEQCGGLMKPIDLEQKHGKIVLIHECQKCGVRRKVKMNKNDDYEEVLKIMRN